ncbi:Hypothetical protein (Fragment) [Durusdinium trenchii]|uniref:Uncharacterized protein n=1 Tax=Durusdinium trenchii TaxID=1381693 RepID=A0ABP0J638_9DINO
MAKKQNPATGDPELLGRLLCCASAGGALPPSLALLKSPSLRPAVRILLELQRLEGQQVIDSLIDCALEQMETGQLDWSSITDRLPSSTPRAEAAARVAARPAAEAAVRLMTLGNNLAEEVTVQQGDGLKMDGLRTSGVSMKGCLQRCAEDGWGQWASYFVAEGPEDLIGQRLVACKRVGGERIVGEKGKASFKAGDLLYFAMPDRAALLEMATYDQLPEFSAQLALMFREGLDERGVVAPPEMLEAAKFLNSIQDLNEAEEAERRLYRFEKSPLARRAFEDLQLDELWAEFWPALTPRLPEIYKALRKAMLRARPLQKMEPRRVSVVRINVLGVAWLQLAPFTRRRKRLAPSALAAAEAAAVVTLAEAAVFVKAKEAERVAAAEAEAIANLAEAARSRDHPRPPKEPPPLPRPPKTPPPKRKSANESAQTKKSRLDWKGQ